MRRLALACAFVLGAPALAHAKKPKRPARRGPYGASSRVERPAEASGRSSLRLRSIDFSRRAVVVEVGGFLRAPAGNLFAFIDDRGRHFVATRAHCDDPFASGVRVCDLTTPEGYERHPWVGLELHLHGLRSATVAAPREEVERAYEAAHSLDGERLPAVDTPHPTQLDTTPRDENQGLDPDRPTDPQPESDDAD